MNWIVYILKCGDGSLYTGITNNVVKRLAAHEAGTGAKYTKGRGPLLLVYEEPCLNRSDASKRELNIKSLSKQQKQKLVTTAANSICI
ncbi:MAG: GIY-YIG nuclease family protein [Sneathiella sp.]